MTRLTLESISKSYVRGRTMRQALFDVSLEVCAGEFVAIHGDPRSGKSTLLRVAGGIEAPDRGRVSYGGQDLASMSRRELADYRRGAVAWVCESRPSLPGYSAIDYVTLSALAPGGCHRGADTRAQEALRLAGVEDCCYAGLHELSESEGQRVAIAHALVRHPRILLADEPVAGLGLIESRAILGLFRNLAEKHKLAVVMTAADASELLGASRVVGLSGGRLLEPESDRESRGALVEFPRRERSSDA